MDVRPIFVLLVSVVFPVIGTTTKFLNAYCNETSTIYVSAHLERYSNFLFSNPNTCTATFKASVATNRLSVRFNKIFVPCDKAHLKIYDGKSPSSPMLEDTCGDSARLLHPFQSSGQYLTVTLIGAYGIFNIELTEFHEGSCLSGEYSCLNGQCISDKLACDGYDNCSGDDSDEDYGCPDYIAAITAFRVGLGVGIPAFVIVTISVIFGLYRLYRRRRMKENGTPAYRNRTTVLTTQNVPPPVTLQMAPPTPYQEK